MLKSIAFICYITRTCEKFIVEINVKYIKNHDVFISFYVAGYLVHLLREKNYRRIKFKVYE